jgi:predicted ATPase
VCTKISWEQMHTQSWRKRSRRGSFCAPRIRITSFTTAFREAAYSLIPQELRAAAHLRIGMLMAAHSPPNKLEEEIFEIVNQLNRGTHLITSARERERIAELNLIAGRRAKISTAYDSALTYLSRARDC